MTVKEEIETLLRSTNREGVEDLLAYFEESDFYEAPASTRFHSCYKGGLADHVLNATYKYLEFNEQYHFMTREEAIIAGINHDDDKIHAYLVNLITDKKTKQKVQSTAKPYTYIKKRYTTHGRGSVEVVERYIKLTDKERRAIEHHMMWFQDGFRGSEEEQNIIDDCPEVYFLFMADFIATHQMEGKQ